MFVCFNELSGRYVGDRFVSLARRNSHKFPTLREEQASLIYNSSPEPDPNHYFEQIYTWVEP